MKKDFIVIIGKGISGEGAAALCRKKNYDFTIISDDDDTALPENTLVVVSPGVHPEKSPLYRRAVENNCSIVSEMEFGFAHLEIPVLAITGTNGKTTTTELTDHLLKSCGVRSCVAGNIGRPLSFIAAKPENTEIAVVEVSSFQLEKISTFAPKAAVILNFASDHLDRYHGNFEEYCTVKKRIFERVSPENQIYGLSFGKNSGRVRWENGKLFFRGKEFFDLSNSDLQGFHNAENCAAAVELTSRVLGEEIIFSDIFANALRSFRRGEHRIDVFQNHNGIRFVDDSKGTNPAAVLAAIDTFPEGKLVILLGGLGKGMDFSVLASRAERFRLVAAYGQDRQNIIDVLQDLAPVTDCGSDFAQAVKCACCAALPGDTVLLSPACASMDMFKNYADRGNRFKELVNKFIAGDL